MIVNCNETVSKFQDIEVEKEFDQMSQDILQVREDLKIIHAGILSNYIIKGSGKKINPDGDATENQIEEITDGD